MRTLAVVSAGLGEPSSTRLLADRLGAATASALVAHGAQVDVTTVDLRDHARALADRLVTGFAAPALQSAIDAVGSADGVVAVTPIYSGSYSGLFKTFVDVLDRDALDGVPVLLGATGGTARHSLAVDFALRPLFAHLRADVVPTAVFAATDDWGSDDAPIAARVERAGTELADRVLGAVRSTRRPRAAESSVTDFADLLAGLSNQNG